MSDFTVHYRCGSFAFADECTSYNQAVARALRIKAKAGVWRVHIKDARGRPVRGGFDLYPQWPGPHVAWSNEAPQGGLPPAVVRVRRTMSFGG
jgi:hypothetical protein